MHFEFLPQKRIWGGGGGGDVRGGRTTPFLNAHDVFTF